MVPQLHDDCVDQGNCNLLSWCSNVLAVNVPSLKKTFLDLIQRICKNLGGELLKYQHIFFGLIYALLKCIVIERTVYDPSENKKTETLKHAEGVLKSIRLTADSCSMQYLFFEAMTHCYQEKDIRISVEVLRCFNDVGLCISIDGSLS